MQTAMMLVCPHRLLFRQFCSTGVRSHLVGPPHPVSNIRPVIYDDVPPVRTDAPHPYSLREFRGDTQEYQWKMQRQQLDAYNHAFWADSNSRFDAAKSAMLESLPETSSAEDRESALSDFYRRWLVQETARQQGYSAEWRKRNWSSILLGARLQYEKLMARISSPFASRNENKNE
ncbi:hypothetical protein AcW1_005701 [Taiwanofungus camphoratus]|nr:hypothetical protein AcW2_004464 [Antrodia cinnamomea]KAI0933076.1 hypothetical protein AcV7_004655 [Antrodia cinnamomea]KAI0934056.1 hypothetical protein AcV5_006029 [Antrodia cinnamomea]KAI0957245.1 hypothetical protein AcW1_005701 [Antrodia cinnamomea]